MIIVLSILTVSWVRNILYYFDYLARGALTPAWKGVGAALLNLGVTAFLHQAISLYRGFHPEGHSLVQNAGAEDRQGAWELGFQWEKTLSLFAVAAGDAICQEAILCDDQATDATLKLVEENLLLARRGKGGHTIEKCKSPFMVLQHFASRELEPQFHKHVVVFNIGVRDDGTVGAILSKPLYDNKLALGAYHRAELAANLQRQLGLRIEVHGKLFRLAGVSESHRDANSTRRKQIQARLKSKNFHSSRAAQVAALDTRAPKNEPDRDELMATWRAKLADHGFGQEQAHALLGKAPSHDVAKGLAASLREGLKNLRNERTHWTEMQLLEQVCIAALHHGVSGQEAHRGVKALLKHHEIVALGHSEGVQHYVTRQDLELEQRMLRQIEERRQEARFILREKTLRECLERNFPLGPDVSEDDRLRNQDQRKGLEYLGISPGSVTVLNGYAGTGKTFLMRQYAELATQQGFRVTALTVAGIAARNLQEATGIECETLAMRLKQFDHGTVDTVKHHAKQLARAAHHKRTYSESTFTLTNRDILIADEASMVSCAAMARLVEVVDRAGAKLVLVGDHRQLTSIEGGSPFKAIAKAVGQYELTHITRQALDKSDSRPTWARDVVRALADGESQKAVELLRERGKVTVASDRQASIDALLKDWAVEGSKDVKNTLILATTNKEADDIALRCQKILLSKVLREQKRLPPGVQVGDVSMFVGDYLRFTKKSRRIGIENGQRGTLVAIHPKGKSLVIETDSGRQVTVNLKQYPHLKLAYSSTVFSAQGATLTRAYHLISGRATTQQLSYVMASRGREQNRFYTDRFEAGNDLEGLAKQMSLDRSKGIASDFLQQVHRSHQHDHDR